MQFITPTGPRQSPLSQGPRPAFVKIFYTPCVRVQTHQPKSLEAYKGRVNTITITPSFTYYVFKQLSPRLHSNQLITRISLWLHPIDTVWRQGWLVSVFSLSGCDLQDSPAQRGSYPSIVIPTGTKHRVQSPLERWPPTTSTDRPKMGSRPYEILLHREKSILTPCWNCFFGLLLLSSVITIIHKRLPQRTLHLCLPLILKSLCLVHRKIICSCTLLKRRD